MPKISLIVGVFNGERYLRELLDSVCAQTFKDWNCICVDDGSTDSSAQILSEYAAKDKRFTVLKRPNGGVGAARNTGLDAADSPYIMFADQDDLLKPNAMERALAAIVSSRTAIVRFQSNRAFRRSPFVWERIFSRQALGNARFAEITGGEDTAFLWQLDLEGLRAAEIPDELYWNRPNGKSFSRAVSPQYIRNVFAGLAAMRSCALSHQMPQCRLFVKMFPHVFMFSASVVLRHFTPSNIHALFCELGNFLAPVNAGHRGELKS